jgi:D-alanine-D-alanine ligase
VVTGGAQLAQGAAADSAVGGPTIQKLAGVWQGLLGPFSMRPLTFGVLVSVGPGGSSPDLAPDLQIQRADRTMEGYLDLRSATDVSCALRALGHEARPLAADDDLDLTLRQSDVDACLLTLHGRRGGLGDVQALLTLRSVPFAGAPAPAVSLAFDKVRSRQLLAYHNIPVPAAVALGGGRKPGERALELLGWPCVVKPRRGAGGLGVALLRSPEQLREAFDRALDVDDELVLERAMDGIEVQVVLVGDRVLGSVELTRSFEDCCPGAQRDMVCPPRFGRARLEGIHSLARRAVAALGLEDGLSRVDVLVTDRHNEVVLEVEPLPPLHSDGVVARVARAAGFSYEALIGELADRIMLRVPEPRLQSTLLQ